MSIIRSIRKSDIEKIDEIYRRCKHDEHFSIPDLTNSITSAVVEHNGEVVGFGVVKILAEAIMVLDTDKPKVVRLDAMDWLMGEAHRACRERGIEHLHVFVQDHLLIRLLEQKWNFRPVTGAPLVREV